MISLVHTKSELLFGLIAANLIFAPQQNTIHWKYQKES
jgi:hypothetical protein